MTRYWIEDEVKSIRQAVAVGRNVLIGHGVVTGVAEVCRGSQGWTVDLDTPVPVVLPRHRPGR